MALNEDAISKHWRNSKSHEVTHDSIANYVNGLGTGADPATQNRPTTRHRLSVTELEILYLQVDLAKRIVDELVDDAVRGGWEVVDADTNEPVDEPDHLDVKSEIKRAGKLGRLYGGAHIFPVDPSQKFDQPPEDPPYDVKNLLILDRYEASVAEYTTDIAKPNFGDPKLYSITPTRRHDNAPNKVHHKWLLEFGGSEVPSQLDYVNDNYDDSVLQSVWNPLSNFVQSENAIANVIQRFETSEFSIEGLSKITQDGEAEEMIQKRVRLVQKTLSAVNAALIDKDAGEEYNREFANVQGLDTLWDRLAHSVAKAAAMPMTQLFGMSPSGLATDDQSGRANWRKQVASYQENQLRPVLEWYYYLVTGRKVEINFNPLDETSAKERAQIEKLRAEARATYVNAGVIRVPEVRKLLDKDGLIETANKDDLTDDFVTDPYTGPDDEDIPSYVPENVKPDWVKRFNEVYESTNSEHTAFRQANALLDSDESKRLDEPFDDYEVTRGGHVYSPQGKVEPVKKERGGHLVVHLYDGNGDRTPRPIHQLVMEQFGSPPPDDVDNPVIHHKDGDPENNDFDNLEWVSKSENNE